LCIAVELASVFAKALAEKHATRLPGISSVAFLFHICF
jgi:hypothetical protein